MKRKELHATICFATLGILFVFHFLKSKTFLQPSSMTMIGMYVKYAKKCLDFYLRNKTCEEEIRAQRKMQFFFIKKKNHCLKLDALY